MLDPLLCLLNTSDPSLILDNKLAGYADDSTLLEEVHKPGSRVSSISSLNRDLACTCDWGYVGKLY